MRRVLCTAVVVGLSSAALLAATTAASAATKPACKSSPVYGPIADRLTRLQTELSQLSKYPSLTPSDKGELYSIITSDIGGLKKLNAEIEAPPASKATLATDEVDVYRDFRVYLLVGPQFDVTTAADSGAKAALGLQSEEAALATDATTPEKKAEYSNLIIEVKEALGELPGIGPSLLAQTPFTNFGPVVSWSKSGLDRGLSALNAAEADAAKLES
jgi:hypothetical protein